MVFKANCKRQFQVRRLALIFCDLYRFSYENMAGRIILFEEAAILNLRTTAVFEFQMVTKSLTLISEKLCLSIY